MSLPIVAATLAEMYLNQEDADDQRDDAIANIRSSYASSMGTPTYGSRAAMLSKQIDDSPGRGIVKDALGKGLKGFNPFASKPTPQTPQAPQGNSMGSDLESLTEERPWERELREAEWGY